MKHVHQQLLCVPSPDWTHRFIFKLFLLIKHEKVSLRLNGHREDPFQLDDACPTENGMTLIVRSSGRAFETRLVIPWRECLDINGHGLYLNPSKHISDTVKFIPGWFRWQDYEQGHWIRSPN